MFAKKEGKIIFLIEDHNPAHGYYFWGRGDK
jgi:hypothetical protein